MATAIDDIYAVWQSLLDELEAGATDAAATAAVAAPLAGDEAAFGGTLVGISQPEISLPVVIAALAGLLALIAGVYLIAHPFNWMIRQIPFIGPYLAAGAQAAFDWAYGQSLAWVFGAVAGIVYWGYMIRDLIGGHRRVVMATLRALVGRVQWITYVQVPWAHDDALRITQGWVWQSEAQAQVEDASTLHSAQLMTWQAEALAQSLHADALAEAHAWVIDAELQASTQQATTLQALRDAEARIGTEIAIEVNKIGGELQASDALQRGYTDAKVAETAQSLQQEQAAALATALAAAGAVGAALGKYLDQCGNDMCEANGKNAKNVLQLGKLLETGAALAYFAAAIRDPEDTARVTADVLVPIESTAVQLVDALVTRVAA